MPAIDQESEHQDGSLALLARFRAGDDRAASTIYRRFAGDLLKAARQRLSARMAARIDAEDIVQSTYRSFFRRARAGDFATARSGDLGRLLAGFVQHKLLTQVERHTAARRSIRREMTVDSQHLASLAATCRKPAAEAAIALADALEHAFAGLSSRERHMFELRLQGDEYQAIASKTGNSERTVRRLFAKLKKILNDVLTVPHHSSTDSMIAAEMPSVTPLDYEGYRLLRLIGAGGMGKAYAALEKRSRRQVAIKVLRKAKLTEAHAIRRFIQESRTVARLRHPHIVPVHGLGRLPDGGYFMVFDLIDGQDLSRVIRQRQFDPHEAQRIVVAAAAAIEHAHCHGVVHCDLKPSNVLVDSGGRIAVTDSGLARVCGASREQGDERTYVAGTAGYMAPEQVDARFGPIGPLTDVHGLGGLLYALLSGQAPYQGTTPDEVLAKAASMNEFPVPLAKLRPDAPASLLQICARCLSKWPEDRYPSAQAVARALANA